MKIENKNIDIFHYSELSNSTSCHIFNSIIRTIDFDIFEPDFEIIIENCLIYDFSIHGCWFKKGLTFKNNLVMNFVDYQMGGHNEKPLKIIGNIFNEFVNFFDCHFKNQLELQGNIFTKGTNLLGNLDEGFKNSFDSEIIIKNNIGNINEDGLGR